MIDGPHIAMSGGRMSGGRWRHTNRAAAKIDKKRKENVPWFKPSHLSTHQSAARKERWRASGVRAVSGGSS